MTRTSWLTSLLLILVATPVLGGGFANLNIGTTRPSMLATVSNGEDPSMVFHNPANLAYGDEEQIYASLDSTLVSLNVRLRYPDGQMTGNIEPTQNYGLVPFLGYKTDFGTDRLGAGLAFYFPNLYGAALPEDEPTRYMVTKALFIAGYLTPAVGYRITDWLALGGAFDLIYVKLNAERAFNLAMFADDDIRNYDQANDFWLDIDVDQVVTSWHAGLTLEPVPDLRLSAVYYAKTDLDLEGDLDMDTPESLGGDTFRTWVEVGMLIPESWRFGVSYSYRGWTAGFDYNWWKYSDYQVQRVVAGTAELLGSDLDLSSHKESHNSKNIGLGLRYQANPRLSVSLGYYKDWTATPAKRLSIDNPNLTHWGLGLGAKYLLTDHTQVEFSYRYANYEQFNNYDSETTPPTNGIGDGYANSLGLGLLYRM